MAYSKLLEITRNGGMTMRLIDVEPVLDSLKKEEQYAHDRFGKAPYNGLMAWGMVLQEVGAVIHELESQPTIDAEPIGRDIPKAPTDQQLEEDGYGAWGSLYGNCPNCNGSVYEEQNYCEKCGQRLDWGNGDPNGFNDETVQALKDTTERKNLSKVYDTLDDMYADMDDPEWREYIYRVRETADGEDGDRMAELIRCRDCKRWNTKDGMFKDIDERQWHECPYLGVPTDEWFFCRDAKRRDDEN